MSDLVVHKPAGEVFVAQLAPSPASAGVTRHHQRSFDDYDVAKAHVLQAVGDLTDLRLFGRQVACAVFCRPIVRPFKRFDGTLGALYTTIPEIKQDWYEHKVVLILKCGPGAFKGDDSYISEIYGEPRMVPQPGDWLFANANAGIQVNLAGDGASRPQALDMTGAVMDIYGWDGWPCRIIPDDQFLGGLDCPQAII